MTGKLDASTFGPAGHVGDENGWSMGGDTHVRVSDNTILKDREYPSIVSVYGSDPWVFETRVDVGISYVPSSRPDVATSNHYSEETNSDCIRNASNATTIMHKSPNVEESFKEINDFTKELEASNNQLWLNQTTKIRSGILEIICDRWDTLSKLQENAQTVDDNPGMVSSSIQELRVDGAGNDYMNSIANINSKFFSKMETLAGYGWSRSCFRGWPWLIHNSSIILKNWSMDTGFLKEELTRMLIWVKLHDVPTQVFEKDGISLIATFIGKPIMLYSYISSMCNDSWGRSSFARCLIKVNSYSDLMEVVTIGVPSLTEDDFTKETIRVEYE
nr:zinc knuckle CX2CX4HX4C [Tanacetum cinerariifolium]